VEDLKSIVLGPQKNPAGEPRFEEEEKVNAELRYFLFQDEKLVHVKQTDRNKQATN